MKRLLFFGVLTLFSLSLAFIAGCDEDKDLTGSGTPNPADSAFLNDFFGEGDLFGSPFQSISLSFALLDSIPRGTAPKSTGGLMALEDGDEEIIITAVGSYSYSNGWHIFQFEALIVDTVNNDTIDVVGSDSVQLLENGVPVQYPTEMDGLKARSHVDWDQRSSSDHGDANHAIDMSFDTVGSDIVMSLGGSVHDTLHLTEEGEHGFCDIDVTLDQTVTNLQVQVDVAAGEGDCPFLSGEVSSSASLDVLCVDSTDVGVDSLTVSGTWTITATVNDNNTVTISYSDGTFFWSVTEPCEGSGDLQSSWGWHRH